jgi:hypothetical protein
MSVGAAGHAEALQRVDAIESVAQRTEDAGDGLLPRRERTHALDRNRADGPVVVHDGTVPVETMLHVPRRGGDTIEQVLK